MPTYLSPGVYVQEIEAGTRPIEGVGTAVAAFVGVAPMGPENTPTLVSNWTQFVDTFGGLAAGSYLGYAVYGYFNNGGGNCYVVRITAAKSPPARGAKPTAALAAASTGGYLLTAKAASTKGVKVTFGPATGDDGAGDLVSVTVSADGKSSESWERLSVTPTSPDFVATRVSAESKLVTMEVASQPVPAAGPLQGTYELTTATTTTDLSVPGAVNAASYIGDAAQRTGFGGLEAIEEVTMVTVPDLMAAYEQGAIDLETVKAVQLGAISHCELMGDRLAILDTPPGLNAQEVREWRVNTAGYDSKFAAMYYPWVKVQDPVTSTIRFVPPSGHVAGIWARNDAERGVHKAPANEIVRGAVDLHTKITRTEQELLNPIGVNVIRSFPGGGIRVWGARTLSSDPAWRYVNLRRLFNYLEKSILTQTQFAVFEPNDQALWGRLTRTIRAFLLNEWRAGSLFGSLEAEAFFVKCDAETNPPEVIDAGQVICQIGVAPVKPAEFVVFQLAQFSSGTGLVGE
ncbi:MAG: uncharacterized protein QOE37_1712 [Microbacteriaceae bacterium]|jgi:phage tail sheath protein FI|nr:uncharacterized protein [Microbacteriaceae bacterium]